MRWTRLTTLAASASLMRSRVKNQSQSLDLLFIPVSAHGEHKLPLHRKEFTHCCAIELCLDSSSMICCCIICTSLTC